MRYIADLHTHSHYSRATSRNAHLEGFWQWAQIKGIDVVGTGDFTHPAWFRELKGKLIEDGSGFYSLKNPPRSCALPGVSPKRAEMRFCLSAEISCIYKKNNATRKIHTLIFAPNLECAAKLNSRLSAIGNIASDGRPILGLDARDLLEIVLGISDDMHLVPAHIWTPWFSLFGSKSGFNSIEECFGDLASSIFALETGLSSDPPMNWRWSALDRFALLSNSDCHSPGKLGREANMFDTACSYTGMFSALKSRNGFRGTMEFFPEEGKYHLDGHRGCNVCFNPEETAKHGGLCPACNRPLTIGVLNRVLELSNRKKGERPANAQACRHLIPLVEIISEVEGAGTASKTVMAKYGECISGFGSEFNFLVDAPLEEIRRIAGTVYAEAVQRMRTERIKPQGGYDGEFGVIRVFSETERKAQARQTGCFGSARIKLKNRTPENGTRINTKRGHA